jgi:hypothetical protein
LATKKRTTRAKEGALSRAEHRLEKAVKDAVAEVENRVMVAGEVADESTSSEVNILSTLEVAIHPPNPDAKAKRKKRT